MKIKPIVFPGVVIVMLAGFLLTGVFSCRHDTGDLSGFTEVCFERDVLPIFQTSCGLSGCHQKGGGESNYILTNYQGILNGVTPGKPESSPAYTALSAIWSEGMMPPDQPLSLNNRTIIRLWIEQGALNTTCPDTTTKNPNDTIAQYVNPRACFQRDIFPVLQSNCSISGCHDGTGEGSEYLFTSYTTIMKSVRPGDPTQSKLYRVITTGGGEDKMPPYPHDPLTTAQIDSIYNWIGYGATDENCGVMCDTTITITYADVVWPMIETNCKGCHSGSSPSGSTLLTSYNEVSTLALSGKLAGVLRGTGLNVQMPPSGSLPDCQIRQIEIWTENGAQNNK